MDGAGAKGMTTVRGGTEYGGGTPRGMGVEESSVVGDRE